MSDGTLLGDFAIFYVIVAVFGAYDRLSGSIRWLRLEPDGLCNECHRQRRVIARCSPALVVIGLALMVAFDLVVGPLLVWCQVVVRSVRRVGEPWKSSCVVCVVLNELRAPVE